MLLTIINIYIFIALFITAYIVTYLFINGKTSYTRIVAIIAIGVFIYLYGYLMEMNTSQLEISLFWNLFQYIAIPFLSQLLFLMALYFTGKIQKYNKKIVFLSACIPIITFILRLTNNLHHLCFTGFTISNLNNINILFSEKAIWYYINSVYTIMLIFCVVIILYIEMKKENGTEKRKYKLIMIATLLPIISIILIILNFLRTGLDYAALTLPVVMILLLMAIKKYDFLDVYSMARNYIFENSERGTFLVSKENRILDYNKTAVKIFNYFNVELSEKLFTDIKHEHSELYRWLTQKNKKSFTIIINGKEEHWIAYKEDLLNRYNNPVGTLYSLQNMTKEVEYQKNLEIIAKTDHLSKLYNRRELIKEGKKKLINNTALLMLDIDHFKRINDTFGHNTGDNVISKISNIIRNSFRSNDITSRAGGEEFVIILSNITKKEAFNAGEKLRKAVENCHMIDADPDYIITISIGIALYEKGWTFDNFISAADKKMYEAKNTGRNKVII